MNKLFQTKSISRIYQDAFDEKSGLKKTLTTWNLISLGIGACIGTGIFVITGTAAAQHAGPALALSFVISGLGCAFAGLCYAEFASMIPVSGSAYTYAYATLGEFMAWIIGWDLIIEYLLSASTVAVGWSGYFVSFLKNFGLTFPVEWWNAPFSYSPEKGWYLTGAFVNLPAVFIILALTVILVIGIQESARFNNVVVIIKVAVILLFIFFGAPYIDEANWTPFIPEGTPDGHFGIRGIFSGAAVIFFAYIGFDAVSTTAQEAKNPQRDMPRGILGSLVICTVLYILVSLVLTGLVNYKYLNVEAPIALAIDKSGPGLAWLSPLVKIGAISGLSTALLVMLLSQPRVFYSMSRDGLLPPLFSKVHLKFKTPYVGSIITGGIAALISALFPIHILSELVSIGTLFAFILVCAGIMILRKTRPDQERPFRTPWVPVVPILGILVCFSQMISLPFDTWMRFIIWLVLGLIIYFTYSRYNSRLTKESSETP